MTIRCECGDTECPSCGIAQGTYTGRPTHECGACGKEYTPAADESEDCPVCGYDGTGDPAGYRKMDPGPMPVSRDTFKFICELPTLHEGDEVIGMVKFMDDLLVCTKHGRLFRVEHTTNNVTECVLYEGTVPPGGSWDERGIVPPENW